MTENKSSMHFSMKLTMEEYELLKQCAEIDDRPLASFVRRNIIKMANDFLNEHNSQKEE